jgi:hypothetical protein
MDEDQAYRAMDLLIATTPRKPTATRPPGRRRPPGSPPSSTDLHARGRAREQARTRRAATTLTAGARRRAEQQAERDEVAHVKAECALREHPALGRWLRQTPSGRLQLDRAKIAADARLDGSTWSPPPIRTCRPRTSR